MAVVVKEVDPQRWSMLRCEPRLPWIWWRSRLGSVAVATGYSTKGLIDDVVNCTARSV
ncbi:hypothetical protein [Mycobacterium leprae]|uniref:hypothetical protein n=1 Tax=Mycobacterium leprae TaxID=1769 RepID=UPI0002F95172